MFNFSKGKGLRLSYIRVLLINGLLTIFFLLFVGGLVFFTQEASANSNSANTRDKIAPFLNQSVIQDQQGQEYKVVENLIYSIVSYVYGIFAFAAILFILLAAYNFLMGGENKEKLEKAKSQLRYAVIAIVIALISGGISLVIESFLKQAM